MDLTLFYLNWKWGIDRVGDITWWLYTKSGQKDIDEEEFGPYPFEPIPGANETNGANEVNEVNGVNGVKKYVTVCKVR